MNVMSVTEVKQIPNSVCNRNKSCKALKRRPIFLIDSDHDFILDKIKRRDTIKYERGIRVDDNDD